MDCRERPLHQPDNISASRALTFGLKTAVDPGTYHSVRSVSVKDVNERAVAIARRLSDRATIACKECLELGAH